MIEIFRTGSAPGVSIPSSAWPDSWYAVRRRSSADIMIFRSAPRTTFSRASVKSFITTVSCPRRAASSAASLTRLRRSAPTIPGVVEAIAAKSTSRPVGMCLVCTSRIIRRPFWSGGLTTTLRSNRPGRNSAGSRISARFVAASSTTPSVPVKPSISVRIWLSVCSRSSTPPTLLAPRARPIASSSSMKMIAGATFFAWSNRSRTRDAPTPTIISMNSDADMWKNGTPASPATARASSVLPVPGGPDSSTPLGMVAPSRRYFCGSRRKSTISLTSDSTSSMPATSANVVRGPPSGSYRFARDRPIPPSPPMPAAPRRKNQTIRPRNSRVGPNPTSTCCQNGAASGGFALTWTFFCRSSWISWSSANAGRWVVNRVTWAVALLSAGYLTFSRNVPWIVSPVEVTSSTLPVCTWARKNVYDTVVRPGFSIVDATTQFTISTRAKTHHSRRISRPQLGGLPLPPPAGTGAPSTRHGGRSGSPWRSPGLGRRCASAACGGTSEPRSVTVGSGSSAMSAPLSVTSTGSVAVVGPCTVLSRCFGCS